MKEKARVLAQEVANQYLDGSRGLDELIKEAKKLMDKEDIEDQLFRKWRR